MIANLRIRWLGTNGRYPLRNALQVCHHAINKFNWSVKKWLVSILWKRILQNNTVAGCIHKLFVVLWVRQNRESYYGVIFCTGAVGGVLTVQLLWTFVQTHFGVLSIELVFLFKKSHPFYPRTSGIRSWPRLRINKLFCEILVWCPRGLRGFISDNGLIGVLLIVGILCGYLVQEYTMAKCDAFITTNWTIVFRWFHSLDVSRELLVQTLEGTNQLKYHVFLKISTGSRSQAGQTTFDVGFQWWVTFWEGFNS